MPANLLTLPTRASTRFGSLSAVIVAAGLLCATVDIAVAAPAASSSSTTTTTTTAKGKPAAKGKAPARTSKGKAKVPTAVAEAPLPAAPQEQLDAAERVYYGVYDCEFKQVIEIQADKQNVGYVEVRHAKVLYTMKPVLSSTGAIRLEDVRGVTLMVQIAQKSMLMDVKVGHRLVDECVSPRQRELMEAAKAKAIEDEKAAAQKAAADKAAAAVPDAPASGVSSGADMARVPPTAASAPVKG